jgi:hypothetical protein
MLQVTYCKNTLPTQKRIRNTRHHQEQNLPYKKIPLETTWRTNPIYATLPDHSKIQSQKYLDKLYTYGITTLTQILNKTSTTILTPEEFRITYKNSPKTIKATLQQAQILFPPTATTLHPKNPSKNTKHRPHSKPNTRKCHTQNNKRKNYHHKRQIGSTSHQKNIFMPMADHEQHHKTMAYRGRLTTPR